MSIGSKIAQYRKERKITQEALAQLLDVTNQAVSKWESDQCCPDIQMLPKLADIFDITIDALFDREMKAVAASDLPWDDDDTLRVVLYRGHRLLKNSKEQGAFVFQYEGTANNITSAVSVSCGDIQGNVVAGTDVKCGNVGGNMVAGTAVYCGNVGGHVDAGTDVNCGNVDGYVDAGTDVNCGNVTGSVNAGADVSCGDVKGDIDAGGSVTVKRS